MSKPTAGQGASVPAVVFGDLEADVWGVLVGGEHPLLSVSSFTGAEPGFAPAEVVEAEDGTSTVVAGGVAMRVTPTGEPSTSTATGDATGHLSLVKVTGTATVEGVERELSLGGLALQHLPLEGPGSTRLFAGWFPEDRALGLLANRAADAKGHDHDAVEVAASGEEQPLVLDPRLSTTYDERDAPLRVGIELWLADSPEAEEQRSRRVAAVATGSHVQSAATERELSAHALRCISRGELGAGVYLLARAR